MIVCCIHMYVEYGLFEKHVYLIAKRRKLQQQQMLSYEDENVFLQLTIWKV